MKKERYFLTLDESDVFSVNELKRKVGKKVGVRKLKALGFKEISCTMYEIIKEKKAKHA